MLSLLGSVLGFGTSFLPKVMDYFQDKQDKKHELFLMDKQLEQQVQLGAQKMQMMDITADIAETEALHKEHASITKKSSQGWMDLIQYATIWNSEFQAIWAAVVSFWFGSRSFNRK